MIELCTCFSGDLTRTMENIPPSLSFSLPPPSLLPFLLPYMRLNSFASSAVSKSTRRGRVGSRIKLSPSNLGREGGEGGREGGNEGGREGGNGE